MNRKNFYIPRIEEEENKPQEKTQTEKKFQPESFVSPISGHNVKDKDVFPYVKYGNKGYQYESLRDKKIFSDEELLKKYGSKYPEFTQISQTQEIINQYRSPKYLQNDGNFKSNSYSNELKNQNPQQFVKNQEPINYGAYETSKEINPIIENDDHGIEYFEEATFGRENTPVQSRKYPDTREYEQEIPLYHKNNIENNNQIDNLYNSPQFEPKKSIVTPSSNPEVVEGFDVKTMQPSRFQYNQRKVKYIAPPIELLKRGKSVKQSDMTGVQYQKNIIDRTLNEFKISGHVTHFTKGPAVTQFEIKLDGGVKVEKVKGIAKNLQMNLQCKSLRIEAPIPGKSTVGVEVPNIDQDIVLFGELLSNPEFLNDNNPLNTILGLDISGHPVYLDISQMPHGLIAGTTGSGKSVCTNSIVTSIIYKASPDDVKLILIDPKIIEFSYYENIPHLATPVINDSKLATASLRWAVEEMERRYILFRTCKRKDIVGYNKLAEDNLELTQLPYIVIVIDELADLMTVAASSVEEYIQRIAQKARAAGIHLIMATQRPSTDIIKGTIKANIQTRIAFAVNSQVDSMTILDRSGAEKLLGKGDMLYSDGVNDIRVQGAYISESEIIAVTDFLSNKYGPNFMFTAEELKQKIENEENEKIDPRTDEYFNIIANFVVANDSASINKIQKKFGIGFNRAQNIMEGLEQLGIVSESLGSRPRNVLVTLEELESILEE